MTTATLALTDFLLARIAEDENAARYAMTRDALSDSDWGGWWLGHYQHYSRYDPDRVLADCAAKRQIVNLHQARWLPEGECDACGDRLPCQTLVAVTLAYANHPDYRKWQS